MPLYEYECSQCGYVGETMLPLSRCDEEQYCPTCLIRDEVEIVLKKLFNKLTTSWKDKDRKWGTSLYRKHDGKEKVKAPKMPTYIPRGLK